MGKSVDYWKALEAALDKHPKHKPYLLDKDGKEIGFLPDPTPVAPPLGQANVADIDMFEVMRARIRNEASIAAQLAGAESFDEADDFDVEDEFEPFSPWEELYEQFRPDGRVTNPERLVEAAPDEKAPKKGADKKKPVSGSPSGPEGPERSGEPPEGVTEA